MNQWAGETCVCIASGPSLTAEDCELVREWKERTGGRVIVVNTSFKLAPWADILYACDGAWWLHYFNEVKASFTGALWTQNVMARDKLGINYVQSACGAGLSRNGTINTGSNSGYQAIGLAYLLGCKRIILLGYDMQTNGKKHWHGDHPGKLNKRLSLEKWGGFFVKLASDLQREGIKVENCTRQSALTCFEKTSLETALGV